MRLGRRMPEEANAWGHAQETLTSGRCCGGDRREERERRARPMLRREGAMLRKEEARNRRSQARTVAVNTQRVPMTRGASLRSRVKGNFQARFWSSGGRGDSPTDCRKLSDRLCYVNLTLMTASMCHRSAVSSPRSFSAGMTTS
jgi:hypothetical protein